MTTLSTNLRYLRSRKKLSQQKFAESIGKQIKQYAKWEEARAEPSITDIVSIARTHEITIDKLLTTDLNKLANKV